MFYELLTVVSLHGCMLLIHCLYNELFCFSNELVSCTLWDDYCVQFLEYLDQHENEGPIIVLLTNARIKEGQGIL